MPLCETAENAIPGWTPPKDLVNIIVELKEKDRL
jgi:hypothetical protein